jgi:hypothetical protein
MWGVAMIDKWMVAEITYVLRLMVDKFERRELSPSEHEVLMMAYRALALPPKEIHWMVNEMENDE